MCTTFMVVKMVAFPIPNLKKDNIKKIYSGNIVLPE